MLQVERPISITIVHNIKKFLKITFAYSQRKNSLTDGHPKCYGLSLYIMKNL